MTILRIGTRRSMLARAQSALVAGDIERLCGVKAELVPIITSGDVHKGSLVVVGGKGLFTAELEAALRAGDIHLAVHSAKDLPTDMPADMALAAVPPREDARDVLVTRYAGLAGLPRGASVGTSSLRRAAQIRALRGDLNVVALRGNIETRLMKALGGGGREGELDAVILAMAGLHRSGLAEPHASSIFPLEIDDFVPAAGQGALALQCRADDRATMELLSPLDDAASHAALLAERSVTKALDAGCHSCLAIHVRPAGSTWQALGMAARPDGRDMVRTTVEAATAQAATDALLAKLKSLLPADVTFR